MKSSIDMFGDEFLREPPVERKPRLTIDVVDFTEYHGEPLATPEPPWYWEIRLDGSPITYWHKADTEPEAHAAAESYVEELIKHFQGGGR